MFINKAIIVGNLTRDPELKALPSGIKVCSFSVATNRTFKDKEGQKKEAVEFHNIVAFGRTGELVAQYMKKGSQICIEGRLQTRSWDQDGQKKYRTEIVADAIQFGNRPTGQSGSVGNSVKGDKASSGTDSKSNPNIPSETIDYPAEDINPEDIPF